MNQNGYEMAFPECQYVANGVSLEKAQQLGDSYRTGNFIEPIGDPVADRISNRLNKVRLKTQTEGSNETT